MNFPQSNTTAMKKTSVNELFWSSQVILDDDKMFWMIGDYVFSLTETPVDILNERNESIEVVYNQFFEKP